MKYPEGCTRAWTRDDPDAYVLHPAEYGRLKSAWMRGEAFFQGADCHGNELVLKLGAVVAICFVSAESLAEAAEQEKTDDLMGDAT